MVARQAVDRLVDRALLWAARLVTLFLAWACLLRFLVWFFG